MDLFLLLIIGFLIFTMVVVPTVIMVRLSVMKGRQALIFNKNKEIEKKRQMLEDRKNQLWLAEEETGLGHFYESKDDPEFVRTVINSARRQGINLE